MAEITHDFRVLDPTTGLGLAMGTMTVVVKNRDNTTIVTYGPWAGGTLPSWLSIVTPTTAGDIIYRFTSGELADSDFPPDFAILDISGTEQLIPTNVQAITVIAALAANATPTVPDARAPYMSVDEADEYFQLELGAEDWFSYDEATKTKALVMGSDELDKEVYKGVIVNLPVVGSTSTSPVFSQRQFPRFIPEFSFVVITDLTSGSLDNIPSGVKQAAAQQALYFLRTIYSNGEDPNDRRTLQYTGASGFTSQGASEQWGHAHIPNNRICPAAYDLIRPYLLVSANIGFMD